MELRHFLQLVKNRRKVIFGIMALFVIVAAIAVAFQSFKYSSESQLLVVQERQGIVVDAYTASKSSEHLSRVLASVVTSNSFFTKVIAISPTINMDYFGTTPQDQIKEWGKTVYAKNLNDTGIIAISVYHPNRSEAEKIAGAVNYVLMTEHGAYDGGGDTVKVRLIDQPVTSNYPVNPNLIVIGSLAVFLGLITGLIYVYLLAESGSEDLRYEPVQNFVQPSSDNRRESRLEQTQPQPQSQTDRYHRLRSPLPEQEFSGVRQPRNEQPVQPREQRPDMTPYGHRTSVSLPTNRINEQIFEEFGEYFNPDDLIDPETIVQKGNMHNIL
jgi:capsular polysaccharide biosynthesis protein